MWEAGIKREWGKLTLDGDADALILGIDASAFVERPVTMHQAARATRMSGIHADPFDRMLIAQALDGPMYLMTADRLWAGYGDIVEVVE